jgi:hypothetical protein
MLGIAQSSDQRDPITLSDEHVELSIVIKATLDILYDHEVPSFKDTKLYHHVIEFARKWDMPIVINTILKEMRIHASISKTDETMTTNSMFSLAVDIGDHDVITFMVECGHGMGWASIEGQDEHEPSTKLSSRRLPNRKLTLGEPTLNFEARRYLKLAPVYSLGGWSYPKFAALPLPLIWAILRAKQATELAFNSSDPTAMPKELKKLLDSMCESPSIRSIESDHYTDYMSDPPTNLPKLVPEGDEKAACRKE